MKNRTLLSVLLFTLISCFSALAASETYFIHNDHLGTAQFITDANEQVVWAQHQSAFGEASVDQDPDSDGNVFTFNMRLPGQYFDAESNLHYNYFRDYDPETGRYIQGDPIGLLAGWNTYSYVGANPILYTDINGLIRNK